MDHNRDQYLKYLLGGLVYVFTVILRRFNEMATRKKKVETAPNKPEWRGYINSWFTKEQQERFIASMDTEHFGEKLMLMAVDKGYRISAAVDEKGVYRATVTGSFGNPRESWTVSGFSGTSPVNALAMAIFFCDDELDWTYDEAITEEKALLW